VVLFAILVDGCASLPSTTGTWVGRVHRIPLEGRRQWYAAAEFEILSGPDIATLLHLDLEESTHGWLPAPILADSDDRAVDPNAFPDGQMIRIRGRVDQGASPTERSGWPLVRGRRWYAAGLPSATQPRIFPYSISAGPALEVWWAATVDGRRIRLAPARVLSEAEAGKEAGEEREAENSSIRNAKAETGQRE
jgi:hypothetical protein